MSSWLFPVIGVVIIGVLCDLVSGSTKMGKFVRAIYSFVILFVIVQPIPKLLDEKISFFENSGAPAVNAELLEQLQNGTNEARSARIKTLLKDMGYGDCIVYVDSGGAFINPAWYLSVSDIIKIRQAVADALGIDITEVNIA
jgi:hypothetical protein